jgi:hypothetical protein
MQVQVPGVRNTNLMTRELWDSDTTRAHISDAGRIVPLEKPREVNQDIIEFPGQHGL